MKDLVETLGLLQDTPVPNILVWLGAILIFLAFVRKVSTFVELTQGQQKWSGVFGGIFLICGIFLFVIPRFQPEPVAALPNNMPLPSPATNTPVLSTNVPESTATSVSIPTATYTPQPTNTPLLPTPVPPTPVPPTNTPILPTNIPEPPTVIWQLNPTLPQPQGFTGWISTGHAENFQSSIWSRGVNVSITENQLLLVFGGLANLPTIGEIGTETSCFLIASRGPLNLPLDLMSARLEVHDVDKTAISLAWAAEKAKVLQEVYPSTCGKGLDVAVGK